MRANILRPLAAAAALAALPVVASAGATITIVNGNAPGVGFNDPTPAPPVGGNNGATLGEQRLNAFREAAAIWGATLDSKAEIKVCAIFEPLSCNATTAVLGSAGPTQIFRDFPVPGFTPAPFEATWYHSALTARLYGEPVASPVDCGSIGNVPADIRARFNVNLGNTGCLTGTGWYLGLDTNGPASQINLVTVLLHEFAHGLGFSSVTSGATGVPFLGYSDAYSKFYYDLTTDKFRDQMTDTERAASAVNPRNVVWTGPHVSTQVPSVLTPGTPLLQVTAPASVAGAYQVGAASFGPQLTAAGVAGDVVLALDGVGATGDACTAIANPAAVAGKIALVDRGTCTFVVKATNVQAAGAIAMVVADNAAGGPPAGLGGDGPSITIPSVRITLADGNAIKAALSSGTVSAKLSVDMAVLAGASPDGNALLFTPSPYQSGSSVSHWDTIAFRNQLMEPAINSDLTHSVKAPEDLTSAQLWDVGWFPDGDLDTVPNDGTDKCPASILAPTVVIGRYDTGVPNPLFSSGCSISDLVGICGKDARNHGAFVSCVAGLGNALAANGIISGEQRGAIQSAAARTK